FFLSSSRRHTRSKRDWSSDVCSSDLVFVSSIQCFNDTLNFIVTPDDWINFSVAGIVGYIGTKLIEQAIFFIAFLLSCSFSALSLTTSIILLNWISEPISSTFDTVLLIYFLFCLFVVLLCP